MSARSTARSTSTSTSTSASSTTCATVRRHGRAVRRGVRARPRVRPPRPGPARASQGGSATAGAEGSSVRTELQADCYAGVWANHAAQTGFLDRPDRGRHRRRPRCRRGGGRRPDPGRTQGQVNPETWTHGAARQRQHWFTVGYRAASRRPATPADSSSPRPSRGSGRARRRARRSRGSGGSAARSSGRRPCARSGARTSGASTSRG